MVPTFSRGTVLRGLGVSLLATRPLVASAADAPMRIGAEASEPFMEPFYAADLGLFAKHNLVAETQNFGNGSVVLPAVLSNAMDIGNTDLVPIAKAFLAGTDVAIIAGGGLHSTESVTIALCVARDSTFRSAKDLEGQTVALPVIKSTPHMAVVEWLRVNGANPENVKFFEMHFSEMAAALQRGTVQAALLGEPFLTDSKATTRVISVPADNVAPHYYSGIWYARRSYLDKNAAAAKRFVDTMYETARWANAHRADSAPMLAKWSKIDVQRIRGMARVQYATSLHPKLAQPLLDFATKYKLLEKPVAATDLIWAGV